MGTFAVGEVVILDMVIQRCEGLVIQLWRAMLWIGTVKRLGEIPDSGFDIFLHGGGKNW